MAGLEDLEKAFRDLACRGGRRSGAQRTMAVLGAAGLLLAPLSSSCPASLPSSAAGSAALSAALALGAASPAVLGVAAVLGVRSLWMAAVRVAGVPALSAFVLAALASAAGLACATLSVRGASRTISHRVIT